MKELRVDVAPDRNVQPSVAQRRALINLISAGLVAVLGLVFCFKWQLSALWTLWTTDPLRSIGMAIPIVSIVLAVRSWRLDDWSGEGSWWGLPLIVVPVALAILTEISPLQLRLHSIISSLNLLPLGLLLAGFISGIIILLGGTNTWRKAWFPVLLLVFLNPVPHWFDTAVDLPLQFMAAHAARAFAVLIGVSVSEGTLKMMFTPRLGMFIAPGCDGLRGAVAMGYLALVIGYLYRLSWRRWAAYIVLAVALAYLFNFIRLCGVVVYYWFAMRIPGISNHATLADYLIGGVLFFCAAFFLFSVPRWWKRRSCTQN